MNLTRLSGAFLFLLALASCGTTTPQIQEFWGSVSDASTAEANISAQVTCELSKAFRNVFVTDMHIAKRTGRPLQYEYIRKWAVQVELLLNVKESSSIDPALSIINPMPTAITHFSRGRTVTSGQSFSLGVGATYSNEATREDKIFMTFVAGDFANDKLHNGSCLPKTPNKATLFVQSDLKLSEWLLGMLNISASQGDQSEVETHPVFAAKPDTLSHDIKFQIVTSGNITPTWKLVRFGTGSSPLVSGSRDRIQQLIITMGPADKSDPRQLGPTATAASISSQISSGFDSAIRRAAQ